MSNQIFKKSIPKEILFLLLDDIAMKNDKLYTFNGIAFKKGVFNDSIETFLEKCKPYYHLSKMKYVERKPSYNNFTTVLRQICKYNNITFTSQIKYDKSNYEIIYYVYHI